MLKLCSNGVHFQTLISLQIKRLVLYSTSSTNEPSNSLVDYLVKSLGFSREKALAARKKVSFSNFKSSEDPVIVVEFLKQRGFDDTQIRNIVSSFPNLLRFNVDKTLKPKFDALQELGFSVNDLSDIIASNASILKRGLNTRVIPMIIFLKSIMGSNENFIQVLKRSYRLMSIDIATVLQPNMELLRNYGLSNEEIRKFMLYYTEVLGHDPKRLGNILIRVENELGISRESRVFPNGIVLLSSLSEKTRESKYKIFKSFGWTDSDIKTMVRKLPRCLMLSEEIICDRLNFFMNELGCKPEYIASRPYVFSYSMEKRILPRCAFLKVIKEKKLRADLGITSAVCTSEPVFLQKYVLPYKSELPELCEAYICGKMVAFP